VANASQPSPSPLDASPLAPGRETAIAGPGTMCAAQVVLTPPIGSARPPPWMRLNARPSRSGSLVTPTSPISRPITAWTFLSTGSAWAASNGRSASHHGDFSCFARRAGRRQQRPQTEFAWGGKHRRRDVARWVCAALRTGKCPRRIISSLHGGWGASHVHPGPYLRYGHASGHPHALERGRAADLVQRHEGTIGAGTLSGKLKLVASGSSALDLVDTFTLLGDPATNLNLTLVPWTNKYICRSSSVSQAEGRAVNNVKPTPKIVQQKSRGPPSGAALLPCKTWRLR